MLSKVVKARETDWPLKDLKEVISRQKGQGKSKSPEIETIMARGYYQSAEVKSIINICKMMIF